MLFFHSANQQQLPRTDSLNLSGTKPLLRYEIAERIRFAFEVEFEFENVFEITTKVKTNMYFLQF